MMGRYAMRGLAVVVGAILLLGGCGRAVDRVERADPVGTPHVVVDQRVQTDRGLHRKVAVVSVRETTVSGDLLKIEADVENLTNSPRRFLYMIEWFDQQGMRINGPRAQWRTHVLQGRQRGVISAVAGAPQAVDFRLHLMEPSR